MATPPKPCDKPAPPTNPQEATRANNGQHQTAADWMRRGGKNPAITR